MQRALTKKLGKELSTFGTEFTQLLQGKADKNRLSRTVDSPGHIFGLDSIVRKTCDEAHAGCLQFIDRNNMTEVCHAFL